MTKKSKIEYRLKISLVKRIYTFLVVFIFYNTAFGQLNAFYSEYNQNEVTDNRIKELKIRKIQVHRKDNIDSIAFKNTYELNLFEFNTNGNTLMSEKSIVIDSDKRLKHRFLFEYDNKNNLTKESEINFKDSIIKISEYFYENGRNIMTLIYGGNKNLLNKYVYHYDSESKLKYEEFYDYVDENNNQLIHNVYKDNLLQQKSYYQLIKTISTGEQIDLPLKRYITFKYNDENIIIEKTNYDAMKRIVWQEKYSYSQEKKEYGYHKYNSDEELSNASVSVFDNKDNLVESSNLVHKWVNGKRSKEMQKRIFHYDEHNYLTKIVGKDIIESRFSIEKNKNKNWVKVLEYNQNDKLEYIYVRDIEYY